MKLRNKLILSCAALAAVATTAVSTTFAWYTANTDVSASGVSAQTLAGSDKLLLISSSGAKGTWGSSITLANAATFEPVSFENGKYLEFNQTLVAANSYAGPDTTKEVSIDPTAQSTSGKVLNFNIYLRNGGSTAFDVKVTKFLITNTTAASTDGLPSKTLLKTDSGLTTTTEGGATYTCDLMRALVVRTRSTTVTGNAGTGGYTASDLEDLNTTVGSGTSAVNYNLFNLDSYTSYADTVGSSDNAHTYYNAVTGKTLVESDKATARTTDNLTTTALPVNATASAAKTGAWNIINVPAANEDPALQDYVVINFQVFLNGWDLYCFDAVQGQQISIDLAFSVVETA